jgi:hypothetical protein
LKDLAFFLSPGEGGGGGGGGEGMGGRAAKPTSHLHLTLRPKRVKLYRQFPILRGVHRGNLTFIFVLLFIFLHLRLFAGLYGYAFNPNRVPTVLEAACRVRIVLPEQFVFCFMSALLLWSMASKHFQVFLVNPGQFKLMHTVCDFG